MAGPRVSDRWQRRAVAIVGAGVLVIAYPAYLLVCGLVSAISRLLYSFAISLSAHLLFISAAWLLLLFIMESLAALHKGDFTLAAVADRTLERGRTSIAAAFERFHREAVTRLSAEPDSTPRRLLRRGLETVHRLLIPGCPQHLSRCFSVPLS